MTHQLGVYVPLRALFLVFYVELRKRIHQLFISRYTCTCTPYLGPVVQSIVSLTTSLRHYFVKYMPTTLSNPL